MNDIKPDMRKQIETLILDDPAFLHLEKRLDIFCPFEALGVVRAEIRHAYFLSHILNPASAHGFGTLFLRNFLSAIMTSSQNQLCDRLRVHIADLDDTKVLREEIDRIDLALVLESEKIAIVIELKVDSKESLGQLSRYRQKSLLQWPVGDGWQHEFLFLTPGGDAPSDPNWRAISYDLIIMAIESTIKNEAYGLVEARMLLKAYGEMLRRKHMENDELRELAQDLWRRNRDVLNYLMEFAPDSAGGFSQYIIDNIDRLTEKANSQLITLVSDRKTSRYINFGIEEWDLLPGLKSGNWTSSGRILMLEIDIQAKYIDIKFIVGPGPDDIRNSLIKEISIKTEEKFRESKKWTQISKIRLKRNLEELQEDEFPGCFDELIVAVRNFVKKSVEPLDPAVRRAVNILGGASNL
jgi:hypothetical protein